MIFETFMACMGACTLQSSLLFWIKPIIKSQHVYGKTMSETFKFLKNQPDKLRFYRGFIPAVLKSGIGRTSDISIYQYTSKNYDNNIASIISGVLSGALKVTIMPLDTISNIYQVHGKNGYKEIKGNLYRGTLAYGLSASISSTLWLTSYSYFIKYNLFTNENLNFLFTGFTSSLITDLVINPIRVIKTNKQAYAKEQSYKYIINNINKDVGFYRGFKLRLGYNAINGALFVFFWKNLNEMIINKG